MALAGALLLIFVLIVRPQEFIPQLQALSLLNVATGITVLGVVFEFATGKQRSAWTPQLPWLAGFILWAFFATMVRLGGSGGYHDTYEAVGLSVIFMLVITYSVRTFTRYRAVALLMIAVCTVISLVCIHQGQQEPQCIELDTTLNENEKSEGNPDGRSCDNSYICEREGKDGFNYDCEKVGLFGTFTQGRRVRWRGTLGDPNELAVLVGAVLPFLFAFQTVAKKKWLLPFIGLLLGIALYCVVLTGSRGGQLVILTVFGVYFVRRYGAKGIIVGAVVALPVLLLGGREGEEAESSSAERIQLLYEGMDMIKAYQPFGVGVGQFQENSFNYLTAHNSYVLAAAEMGMPGSFLWSGLVYISMKIPYQIAKHPPPELDPRVPPFAYALLVSFAGTLVGIFFLSFCYKQMLFIYFGLSGALFGIARTASPSFNVTVGKKEIMWLVILDCVLLAAIFVYSRAKGTG